MGFGAGDAKNKNIFERLSRAGRNNNGENVRVNIRHVGSARGGKGTGAWANGVGLRAQSGTPYVGGLDVARRPGRFVFWWKGAGFREARQKCYLCCGYAQGLAPPCDRFDSRGLSPQGAGGGYWLSREA